MGARNRNSKQPAKEPWRIRRDELLEELTEIYRDNRQATIGDLYLHLRCLFILLTEIKVNEEHFTRRWDTY